MPGLRHGYADYLLVKGDVDGSLDEMRLAHDSDPLSSLACSLFLYHALMAREYDEVIREGRRTLAVPGVLHAVHDYVGRALWLEGRHEEALAEWQALTGDTQSSRRLEDAFRRAGPTAVLQTRAEQIASRARNGMDAPVYAASWFAAAGEADQAFSWLEQAYARRDPLLLHVIAEPFFDPIRSDPRFAALLRRIGLSPFPARGGPGATVKNPGSTGQDATTPDRRVSVASCLFDLLRVARSSMRPRQPVAGRIKGGRMARSARLMALAALLGVGLLPVPTAAVAQDQESTFRIAPVVLPGVSLREGVSVDLALIVFTNEQRPCQGRSVLAVHGMLHTAAAWEPVAAALFHRLPRGMRPCRLLAIDLPGHGRSSLPSGTLFGEVTLEDYVSAVLGTLDRLQELGVYPETLAGHSLGGAIVALAQQRLVSSATNLRTAYGLGDVFVLAAAV